jgi:hypothetical protein
MSTAYTGNEYLLKNEKYKNVENKYLNICWRFFQTSKNSWLLKQSRVESGVRVGREQIPERTTQE